MKSSSTKVGNMLEKILSCPECKHEMKTDHTTMAFKINPNIIVQDVKVDVCGRCGFEAVPEDEYEFVRKKVHEIAKVTKEAIVVTKFHGKEI